MAFETSKGYLIVDSTKCCSCMSCMLACSLVHEGKENLSLSRIQIIKNPLESFPDDVEICVCRQCVDPLCVQACPTGACYIDSDNGNRRVINEAECVGCKLCFEACPFMPKRIIWNHFKNVATKCDLCKDTPYRTKTGDLDSQHACIEVCSMKAIRFVTDVPSQIGKVGYDVDLRIDDPK
jgi:protein NrfC